MPDTAINISPVTMQKLGLNPQTIQKIQQERAQREQAVAICRKNGSDIYFAMYQDPHINLTKITLANGLLDISPIHHHHQLLPTIKERLKDLETTSKSQQDLIPQLRAFVEGFGIAALEKKDYLTAIPCLDYASKTGILDNDEAIARIKEVTLNDSEELIKVAEIIESLKGTTAQATPPELSPVVQKPQEEQSFDNNMDNNNLSVNGQTLRPVPPPSQTADH